MSLLRPSLCYISGFRLRLSSPPQAWLHFVSHHTADKYLVLPSCCTCFQFHNLALQQPSYLTPSVKPRGASEGTISEDGLKIVWMIVVQLELGLDLVDGFSELGRGRGWGLQSNSELVSPLDQASDVQVDVWAIVIVTF